MKYLTHGGQPIDEKQKQHRRKRRSTDSNKYCRPRFGTHMHRDRHDHTSMQSYCIHWHEDISHPSFRVLCSSTTILNIANASSLGLRRVDIRLLYCLVTYLLFDVHTAYAYHNSILADMSIQTVRSLRSSMLNG